MLIKNSYITVSFTMWKSIVILLFNTKSCRLNNFFFLQLKQLENGNFFLMWHDVRHSLCGRVCGCQSENPFVCFGAKPTKRVCARDLPRDRKWTREGRSQWQSAGESSQEKVSQEMRAGQRGDQSTEVRKAATKTCGLGPGWPTRENKSPFRVACEIFVRIHARNRLQMHGELHKSVKRIILSCTWS